MAAAIKPLATCQGLPALSCHQEEGQNPCGGKAMEKEEQQQMQTLPSLHHSSSEVLPGRYQDASNCSQALG